MASSTDHLRPSSTPPGVWAAFEKQLDDYVAKWMAEVRQHVASLPEREKFYSEDQPRGEGGRWTDAGGTGSKAVLIATHPETGREMWQIGHEVYIAPKSMGMDTFGHPMGKRWESSIEHFEHFKDTVHIPDGWQKAGVPKQQGLFYSEDQLRDEKGRFAKMSGEELKAEAQKIMEKLGVEHKTAAHPDAMPHAVAVYDRARANEPAITTAMHEIAGLHGGVLDRLKDPEGRPTQTKSLGSLARKISDQVREDERAGKLTTHEEKASQIKDSVRYTVVLDNARFGEGAAAITTELEKRGFTMVDAKNYYDDHNTYRGVNTFFRQNSTGQVMEVQFHTKDSLNLAEHSIHPIYDYARRLPEGSRDWKILNRLMYEHARAAKVDGPHWSKAPGRVIVARGYRPPPRRLAASAEEEPNLTAMNVRFFTTDGGTGLFRIADDDEHFFLSQFDPAAKEWVGWPPLMAALGMGGIDHYVEIGAGDAMHLAGHGIDLYAPEGRKA